MALAAALGFAAGFLVMWLLYRHLSAGKTPQRAPQPRQDGSYILYELRAEIEVLDFGDKVPAEMRYRWNVWQVGISRTDPLMLGNAHSEEEARLQALAWIGREQLANEGRVLPA